MRVGLDTAPLHRAHTGIAVYSGQLIKAMLPRLRPGEELDYFSLMDFGAVNEAYISALLAQNDERGVARQKPVESSLSASLLPVLEKGLRKWPAFRGSLRAARRMWFEQGCKRGRARDWQLFHALVTVPPGRIDTPTIPLLHDISTRRYPEHHPIERVRMFDRWVPDILKAPVINTVSLFSRDEIVADLGISKERIVVTYPGVDDFFLMSETETEAQEIAAFQVTSGNYFLAVATHEPRKNLTTLVAAYAALPDAIQARIPLLLVGGAGWGNLHLPPATQRLIDAGRVRFTGYLTRAALRALYRHTALFLFPSVYEGFGIPTVEALACGAPVAVSRHSSMHEILGDTEDYGSTVEALDVDGWRDAMVQAADAPPASAELRLARHNHARSFDWGRTAEQTLDMYRAVVAGTLPQA